MFSYPLSTISKLSKTHENIDRINLIISENEEKVELYEYFFIIDDTPEDKEFKYYSDYNKTNLFATLDLTTKVDDNFFEKFKLMYSCMY